MHLYPGEFNLYSDVYATYTPEPATRLLFIVTTTQIPMYYSCTFYS